MRGVGRGDVVMEQWMERTRITYVMRMRKREPGSVYGTVQVVFTSVCFIGKMTHHEVLLTSSLSHLHKIPPITQQREITKKSTRPEV